MNDLHSAQTVAYRTGPGDKLERYARSRVSNLFFRQVFFTFCALILAMVESWPMAMISAGLVFGADVVDTMACRFWLQKRLTRPWVIVLTGAGHALASVAVCVVTWIAGGPELRFLTAMLISGGLLNATTIIFLFPAAGLTRLVIYVLTFLGLYLYDGIRILSGDTAMSAQVYGADFLAGCVCLFVVLTFMQFIYRFQVRKDQNDATIAAQTAKLAAQISEREQQMSALAEANRKATSAMAAKSAFLATVSHEIRTPMNGIVGISELLSETDLDDTQRRYVRTIAQSGNALLTIINGILDFSKLEADKAKIIETEFDLGKVISDVTLLLSARQDRTEVALVTDIDPGLPHLLIGDEGKVRQMLINLVGNALKFTDAGHVAVRVRSAVDQDNSVRVTILIEDTGIGIPEDQIDEVFGEFNQVVTPAGRQSKGTGLGLAITRRLIRLMNGQISVKSELGVGTVFTITLPFRVSHRTDWSRAQRNATLNNLRCLIIGNTAPNRILLQRRLELWGLKCRTVASGSEAVEVMTRAPEPFDVILFDDKFSHATVTDTARRLRKLNDDIPILLVSGESGKSIANIPGTYTLAKPLRKAAFVSALSHLGESRESPPLKSEPVQTSLTRDMRLLIADDNPTNQVVMRAMLDQQPVHAHFTSDGHEAVDLFCKVSPDLVFMDISMPGMDGYEATKRIRACEAKHGLPRSKIIALTANVQQDQIDKCHAAGMDGHLAKPITKARLLACLSQLQDDDEPGSAAASPPS